MTLSRSYRGDRRRIGVPDPHARLAGDGLSTRDVAAELGISPRTVETHLASIYGKLGVSSRAELGRAMAGTSPKASPPR